MGYKLGVKNMSIHNKKMLISRYNIYDYNDIGIKVYPKGKKVENDMGLEVAKELVDITTERLLLPQEILFYNDDYAGYSFYKPGQGRFVGTIINSNKDNFVDNVLGLENDFNLLSKSGIIFSEETAETVLYDENLFIFTANGYSIDDGVCPNLEQYNKEQLHALLTRLIKMELMRTNVSAETILGVEALLSSKAKDENSSLFFDRVLTNETIKQYAKKYF